MSRGEARDDGLARADGFAPIESYGVIGDSQSIALVAQDGAIDWWAAPAMDSPPVFAAILDPRDGGCFTLEPTVPYRVSRRYLPGTNVLETTFSTRNGAVRVIDSLNQGPNGPLPWAELARDIRPDRGEIPMRWRVAAGTLFHRARLWARLRDAPIFHVGDLMLVLVTERAGQPEMGPGEFSGEFVARAGENALLTLVAADQAPLVVPSTAEVRGRREASEKPGAGGARRCPTEAATVSWYCAACSRSSSSPSPPPAPWRPRPPHRCQRESAETQLRLQVRVDPRYLVRARFLHPARPDPGSPGHAGLDAQLHFLHRARDTPLLRAERARSGRGNRAAPARLPRLHPGPGRQPRRRAAAVGMLRGPARVRVAGGRPGRRAPGPVQRRPAARAGKQGVRCLDRARLRDMGARGQSAQHVFQDRMLGRPGPPGQAGGTRSGSGPRRGPLDGRTGRHPCLGGAACWSEARRGYAGYAGTDELDASLLLLARTGFVDGKDRRFTQTIEAIRAELADGPLLYRFTGAREIEGAFVPCSFWLIDAPLRNGQAGEARTLWHELISYASDLGLLAEEIDPATGAFLGNLPQGLSHLSLLNAAVLLDEQRVDDGLEQAE